MEKEKGPISPLILSLPMPPSWAYFLDVLYHVVRSSAHDAQALVSAAGFPSGKRAKRGML